MALVAKMKLGFTYISSDVHLSYSNLPSRRILLTHTILPGPARTHLRYKKGSNCTSTLYNVKLICIAHLSVRVVRLDVQLDTMFMLTHISKTHFR